MAKYNRLSEPLEKAKKIIDISEGKRISDETTLKTMDKIRKYNKAKDQELLQFGCDLYHAGYTLNDFQKDIEICREIISSGKDISNYDIFKYDGIEHVPSLIKFLEIVKKPGLFMNIENGYNIERRKDLANSLGSEIKRK